MGKINVKLIIIVIAVVLLVGVGIFLAVISKNNADKLYELEQISEKDYKYFPVMQNGKYGVIDEVGNVIVKTIYDNVIIPNPTKPVFLMLTTSGSQEILNDKGEKLFKEFQSVDVILTDSTITNLPYEKSVLKYGEDGKFGLMDYAGNKITEAIYEEISSVKYKEGEILAKKDGKYGVINNKGIELIPFEYEKIEADRYYSYGNYLKSGYIVRNTTSEGYRYGYINSEWKKLLDTEYTGISRIQDIDSDNVYLIVSKNGRYGVVKNEKVAIDYSYQSIEYNKDTDLYAVQRSGQYGVIDINGNTIIDVQYRGIRFNGIYILASSYTNETYYNRKGEKVENQYISMKEAKGSKSYITIDKNNLYGIIDENGNETVKNVYLYIDHAFDNYFIAYKNGEGLGIIDKTGEIIVNFEYDVLSKIGDNKILKAVKMADNITDIYSSEIKKLTSVKNAVIEINDDYIEIYNENKTDFITKSGEIKNAKELLLNNKLFSTSENGKWGYTDREGNIKVDCIYDYVTEFNRYGFAGIMQNGKWGVINAEGNIVQDTKYEFEAEDEEYTRPEFIGKYYKTYSDEFGTYYTDEI